MRCFLRDTSAFTRDQTGQVDVFFAMIALPLIAITSASVDYTNVVREKRGIKGALDAAVIAAVNNNAIPLSEKGDFAKIHFDANYDGSVALTLTPLVEESSVSLMAEGVLDLTFGQLIGIDNPSVQAKSAAEIASENTICLLALNESIAQSILFDGGIKYNSPACSVHSNSVSPSAIVSVSSQIPETKSFCTSGGAFGQFEPYVKGECKTIDDPYEMTTVPIIPEICAVPKSELIVLKDDAVLDTEALRADLEARLASAFAVFEETQSLRAAVEDFFKLESVPLFDEDSGRNIQISQNVTGSYVDIKPGTFCGGLTVDGIDVDFLPGEYIIKDGPLSFINGAEALANDVTFILAGDGAALNIQSKAQVHIKSPSNGARKGLAVMEAVDRSVPGNRAASEPGHSLVSGGGALSVMGAIYLPTQKLEIRGEGTSVGAMAPATSFIADQLHIDGSANAKMVIGVDHKTAGIPPLLPRAEDGARLTE